MWKDGCRDGRKADRELASGAVKGDVTGMTLHAAAPCEGEVLMPCHAEW